MWFGGSSTQTLHQVTETNIFLSLKKLRLQCYRVDMSFWLVTPEPALLFPPTKTFRLLIGQNGFTVEIIPPVGLACSWPFFKACICVFMWTEIFFFNERRKNFIKNTRVGVDMATIHTKPELSLSDLFFSPRFKNYLRTHETNTKWCSIHVRPVCGAVILPQRCTKNGGEGLDYAHKSCARYTNDHGTIHVLICANVS